MIKVEKKETWDSVYLLVQTNAVNIRIFLHSFSYLERKSSTPSSTYLLEQ